MRIVTVNARLRHDPRLGVANYGFTIDLGKLMNRLVPVTLLQTQQRLALEFVVRTAAGTKWKRIVAVLPDLDTGFDILMQSLSHIVQKRGWNAERNGTGRGRNHLVDLIICLLN